MHSWLCSSGERILGRHTSRPLGSIARMKPARRACGTGHGLTEERGGMSVDVLHGNRPRKSHRRGSHGHLRMIAVARGPIVT